MRTLLENVPKDPEIQRLPIEETFRWGVTVWKRKFQSINGQRPSATTHSEDMELWKQCHAIYAAVVPRIADVLQSGSHFNVPSQRLSKVWLSVCLKAWSVGLFSRLTRWNLQWTDEWRWFGQHQLSRSQRVSCLTPYLKGPRSQRMLNWQYSDHMSHQHKPSSKDAGSDLLCYRSSQHCQNF